MSDLGGIESIKGELSEPISREPVIAVLGCLGMAVLVLTVPIELFVFWSVLSVLDKAPGGLSAGVWACFWMYGPLRVLGSTLVVAIQGITKKQEAEVRNYHRRLIAQLVARRSH